MYSETNLKYIEPPLENQNVLPHSKLFPAISSDLLFEHKPENMPLNLIHSQSLHLSIFLYLSNSHTHTVIYTNTQNNLLF